MSESNPDSNKGCPFCTMPADQIVEAGEHAFVVLIAYPVTPGHSLIVSRRHVADVLRNLSLAPPGHRA